MPFEKDAVGLMAEMAKKRVAVEINLTSNDITPGVKGFEHPLQMYRRAGVPFTLSADDEGVFRIDLTHEYVRAALEQHLTYPDLKAAARNGIEFSFLPEGEKAAAKAALEQAFDRFETRILGGAH
jgi:adenosine deaminase